MFHTWKCCFRRLTGLLLKFYLQQRRWDLLSRKSDRIRAWVCVDEPPLFSLLVFEDLMGQTWKAWFQMMTCDLWNSIIFNIIVMGGNWILMEYMVDIFNELVKYRCHCLPKFSILSSASSLLESIETLLASIEACMRRSRSSKLDIFKIQSFLCVLLWFCVNYSCRGK